MGKYSLSIAGSIEMFSLGSMAICNRGGGGVGVHANWLLYNLKLLLPDSNNDREYFPYSGTWIRKCNQ